MVYNAKSSLSAATTANQTVAENGYLPFDTNNLLTGCSIQHTAGSNSVILSKPGLYEVFVNANISATAAGNVSLKLINNGAEIAGAKASVTAAEGSSYPMAMGTIIRVRPSCPAVQNSATIQLQADAAITVVSANIFVVKLA